MTEPYVKEYESDEQMFSELKSIESIAVVEKQKCFNKCCAKGFIKSAQLLLEYADLCGESVDIQFDNELPFRLTCKNGHQEMAHWLIELGDLVMKRINIHAEDEWAFAAALYHGHNDLAKWLWEFSLSREDPIDLHADDERAFMSACYFGQIETMEWILKTAEAQGRPIDLTVGQYSHIYQSCINGNLGAALWLYHYTNETITITAAKSDIIEESSRLGYTNVVDWLFEVMKDTDSNAIGKILNKALCLALENNKSDVIKVLMNKKIDSVGKSYCELGYDGTLHVTKLLANACKTGDLEKAKQIWNTIQEGELKYTPFVTHSFIPRDAEEVLDWLSEIVSKENFNHVEVVQNLIGYYENDDDLDRIKNFYHWSVENGYDETTDFAGEELYKRVMDAYTDNYNPLIDWLTSVDEHFLVQYGDGGQVTKWVFVDQCFIDMLKQKGINEYLAIPLVTPEQSDSEDLLKFSELTESTGYIPEVHEVEEVEDLLLDPDQVESAFDDATPVEQSVEEVEDLLLDPDQVESAFDDETPVEQSVEKVEDLLLDPDQIEKDFDVAPANKLSPSEINSNPFKKELEASLIAGMERIATRYRNEMSTNASSSEISDESSSETSDESSGEFDTESVEFREVEKSPLSESSRFILEEEEIVQIEKAKEDVQVVEDFF